MDYQNVSFQAILVFFQLQELEYLICLPYSPWNLRLNIKNEEK